MENPADASPTQPAPGKLRRLASETESAADSGSETPGMTAEMRSAIRATTAVRRQPPAPVTEENAPPPPPPPTTPAALRAAAAARAESEQRELTRLQRIAANPAASLALTPQELLRLGIDAARVGEKKTAFERLTTVVKLQPNNSAAWLWLGAVLEDDNPERALECVQRAVALDPNSQAARRGLASVQTTVDAIHERQRLAEEERQRLAEEERQRRAEAEAEMRRIQAEEVARRQAELADERDRARLLRPQAEMMPAFLRSIVGEAETAPPANIAPAETAQSTQIMPAQRGKKAKPELVAKPERVAKPIHSQPTTPVKVVRPRRRGFFHSANVRMLVGLLVAVLILAALAVVFLNKGTATPATATPAASTTIDTGTLATVAVLPDGTTTASASSPAAALTSADSSPAAAPTAPADNLPATAEGRYLRAAQKAVSDYSSAITTIQSLEAQVTANTLSWGDFRVRFAAAAATITDTNRTLTGLVVPQRAVAVQQQFQTIVQLTGEGVDLMNNGIANIDTDDLRTADARFVRATTLLNDLAAPLDQLRTQVTTG